ncbi:PIG-L family deacetylase [Isoptericola sp. AK164]|uniref:PIG-L family deacetylase n=1 Tax=Isoptericola sp. AK164 TaxID=3024246 RepID=UPI00241876B0|nr:PIG-L family deacetylase [Isoptericola sp. AK164]
MQDAGETSTAAARPADPSVGPLVAVHAHPDDETLATGALLAAWTAAGAAATVVTCTRGERGEVIDTVAHPTGLAHLEGDGPALAVHRERELAAALEALGVPDHVFLDTVPPVTPPASTSGRFEDSGMAWVAPGIAGPAPDSGPAALSRVPLEAAASRLAAVLRDRRPAVVVTYEAGGGYRHPDHVRTYELTVRALELAADPAADVVGEPWTVPERWEVVAPADRWRAARAALSTAPDAVRLARAADLTLPDPDADPPPLVVDPAELARDEVVSVAVEPVLDRLLAALAAHATQVQHVAAVSLPGVVAHYALSNGELAPVLAASTARVRR